MVPDCIDLSIRSRLLEPIGLGFQSCLGPACWLWDYLRRSQGQDYFIPLSSGIDSCSTVVIVFLMCWIVAEAAGKGGLLPQIFTHLLQTSTSLTTYVPLYPRESVGRIFHTCYMGTTNSGAETCQRDKDLAEAIGRCLASVTVSTGGKTAENLVLQNIQLPR
ncbi:hypothetical protein DFH07DRAFT_871715 [Mycena maculata]|uniref:Uncharacterized protein n=1 Tax=Mycena maculata TaxID=230809 RepID=A0AAD7HQL7_9AGAR|nr:hypothetical protein DFH07DRAFT_871715 [Mycena maculata]